MFKILELLLKVKVWKRTRIHGIDIAPLAHIIGATPEVL